MTRKVLAVLAVVVEFVAMGGFVIPELALPSRSAFTQFFVMGSYVLLLKWTWCAIAGRKKNPEKVGISSEAVEKREQPTVARAFNFGEFVRRHSSVLLIVVGILAAILIAANRYRLVTAGGTVYRLDRFSGRCEMVVPGMGKPRFVPIREQGENEKRTMVAPKRESSFSYSEFSDGGKKKKSEGFNLSEFLLSGETL